MEIVFVIFLLIAFGAFCFFAVTRRFASPYKLIMVFGKKGSGKTTTMCKLILKYNKKGWKCFCTEHIPGSYYIKPSQIGYVQLPERSLLLVDEVGMIWDNRDYKNFANPVRDFFKLQRHYKVRCYLFSQTFDIDKKLRDLTDEMYLMKNVLRVFSYGKKINKKIVLTEAQADRPSTIAENLCFESLFFFWCGSRFLTYIPKYSRYFNSFEAPQLKEVNFTYEEIPSSLRNRKLRLPSFRLPNFRRKRK